jgi:hypothetical protein
MIFKTIELSSENAEKRSIERPDLFSHRNYSGYYKERAFYKRSQSCTTLTMIGCIIFSDL